MYCLPAYHDARNEHQENATACAIIAKVEDDQYWICFVLLYALSQVIGLLQANVTSNCAFFINAFDNHLA